MKTFKLVIKRTATSAAVLEFIFSIDVFEKIEVQYSCADCGLDTVMNNYGYKLRRISPSFLGNYSVNK